MSHDLETPVADHATDTGPRRSSALTWLVAAAAALVIGGVGAFAVFSRDADHATPAAHQAAPSVLALSARPPVAGKCAVPSAQLLANQQTAFDGTVASIADGLVTLDAGHWYRGGHADRVTVQGPPADLAALVSAADFQVGQRYLVSATDGYVTVCGLTAAYSEQLAALYAEAYGS